MTDSSVAVEFTGNTAHGLPLLQLLRTLRFWVENDEGETVCIKVSAGFVTDFASIPRFLRGILSPWSLRAILASILHDYLLTHPRDDFNRKSIDRAFLSEMEKNGMSWRGRYLRYAGVRIGSGRAYKEFRQATPVPVESPQSDEE